MKELSHEKTGTFGSGNLATDPSQDYLTYFVKPGADSDDTRIWTYDATEVTITGLPQDFDPKNINLISYVNDDVSLTHIGRLAQSYNMGGDVIEAGSLIAVGTYRGDPVFGGVRLLGRFSSTDVEGNQTIVERAIDGEAYLFAEIPEDGAVSTISDGIFIFVFNDEAERQLQNLETPYEDDSGVICDGINILPDMIKAEYFQTDVAESTEKQRVTAETLWTASPGGDDLPEITLESEAGR